MTAPMAEALLNARLDAIALLRAAFEGDSQAMGTILEKADVEQVLGALLAMMTVQLTEAYDDPIQFLDFAVQATVARGPE